MRAVSTVLGVLLGAASLASLIQRLLDVGLAPITQDVLDYYRWFMSDVVRVWALDWWTLRWFDFQMPQWALDVLAIYFVIAATVARTFTAQQLIDTGRANARTQIRDAWFWWFQSLLWPTLLIRFYRLLATRYKLRGYLERRGPFEGETADHFATRVKADKHSGRQVVLALVGTPIGVIAFFVWNAILLSP